MHPLCTLRNFLLYFFIAAICACTASPRIKKNKLPTSGSTQKKDFYGWQKDVYFPVSGKDYIDSVLPNDFIIFTGFKGQGEIHIEVEGIKSFDLFLNQKKLNSGKLRRYKKAKIDISRCAKNGKNILYIARIQKEQGQKGKKAFINIKIPYPVLTEEKARGINFRTLKIIDKMIFEQVKNGFPGCQLLIVKDGNIIKNSVYGYLNSTDILGKKLKIQDKQPVTKNTLYDLASNTKIYAVTFALQKLVYEEKISIHDKVSSFFPDFKDGKKAKFKGKSEVTIEDLLGHRSGLPAGVQFYSKKQSNGTGNSLSGAEENFKKLMETPLSYEPHSDLIYSDIGYMILGLIIEKVTEMPLDKYVSKELYEPLNLKRICYKPLEKGFSKNDCAATEIEGLFREGLNEKYDPEKTGLVQGFVHDPNAYFYMNQVSGHSGLFSNAESLAVLCQLMLNGGGYGNIKLFDSAITDMFSQRQDRFTTAALGWRKQGAEQFYSWAFSPLADKNTIGHTGWTGTLTMIDPKENLIVIFLSNAKNTFPVKGRYSRGRFEGDYFLAKNYGAMITLIYAAINNYKNSIVNNMLVELIEQRYSLFEKRSSFHNKGFENDLEALLKVINHISLTSETARSFLRSKKGRELKNYLKNLEKQKKYKSE